MVTCRSISLSFFLSKAVSRVDWRKKDWLFLSVLFSCYTFPAWVRVFARRRNDGDGMDWMTGVYTFFYESMVRLESIVYCLKLCYWPRNWSVYLISIDHESTKTYHERRMSLAQFEFRYSSRLPSRNKPNKKIELYQKIFFWSGEDSFSISSDSSSCRTDGPRRSQSQPRRRATRGDSNCEYLSYFGFFCIIRNALSISHSSIKVLVCWIAQ